MNLQKALSPLAIAVVALFALAGCGSIANSYGNASKPGNTSGGAAAAMPAASSPAAAVPATGHTVAIRNFTFTPQTLTVKAGTKVTWTNKDSTPHTVTSTNGPSTSASPTGLFDSGQLASGASFSFTFTKAGTYYYECTIHASMASMHATIVVK